MNCPVCKKNHVVTKDIEDFPKNEYIIEYIKEIKKVPKFTRCPQHAKELSLFCADDQCKTAICQVCWIKEHTAHSSNVVDIAEDHRDKKEALLAKVNSISQDVERTKTNLLKMKEQVADNNAKCIAALEARKIEICTELDDMIQKVSEVKDTVDENVKTMDKFLEDLEKIGKCETSTYENIRHKMEMAAEIERDYQTILSKETKIQFYRYNRINGHGRIKLTNVSENGNDGSKGNDSKRSDDSKGSDSTFDRRVDGNERRNHKQGRSGQNNGSDKISEEESESESQHKGTRGPPLKRSKTQPPARSKTQPPAYPDNSWKGECWFISNPPLCHYFFYAWFVPAKHGGRRNYIYSSFSR